MTAGRGRTALAAFVLLRDAAGRVLVCERADGKGWNLPGGGLEAGESPWEGALRETLEETGVEAEIRSLVGLYHVPGRRTLVFLFECSILRGEPRPLSETRDVAWVFPDALPERMLPLHAERVRDWAGAARLPLLKRQRLGERRRS